MCYSARLFVSHKLAPICHAVQDKTITDLMRLIDVARIPTVHRVAALETENDTLKRQLAEARKKRLVAVQEGDDNTAEEGTRAEAEARQKEAEEAAVVPNHIHEYIEMLEEEVCSVKPCQHNH